MACTRAHGRTLPIFDAVALPACKFKKKAYHCRFKKK
jgi:hypothetical protein